MYFFKYFAKLFIAKALLLFEEKIVYLLIVCFLWVSCAKFSPPPLPHCDPTHPAYFGRSWWHFVLEYGTINLQNVNEMLLLRVSGFLGYPDVFLLYDATEF